MSTPSCRLLPYAISGPAENMAADEALLESAAAGRASLRFYGWQQATLSLGYFQSESVARAEPARAALPWVRRPTGGDALVHDREVTYALALPPGPPWQTRGGSWLRDMHEIIATALAALGVPAQVCSAAQVQLRGPVLCFLHHTPGDLVLQGAKVVGSAQRRRHGALLQHGGILLAASPAAPDLPGIAELTGRYLAPAEVQNAVAEAFTRRTGWELRLGDWTEAERDRIAALAAGRYADPAWNRKR